MNPIDQQVRALENHEALREKHRKRLEILNIRHRDRLAKGNLLKKRQDLRAESVFEHKGKVLAPGESQISYSGGC